MEKQALMIYNPYSGRKKNNHKTVELLLKKLSEIGYHITIHSLDELKHNENLIQIACERKWEAIFIAGGDGTINHTLQHLAVQEHRPKIGIFPLGTSNEFAKFIGLPCNTLKALSVIERGGTKKVDIGQFGGRYFANIAAAGWLTDITYKTSPLLKSYIGEFAYSLAFIKALFMAKQPNDISVIVSPEKELRDLSIFLIMNGNSVGPLERLITNADGPDYGYFHLLTCKKTNRIQLFIALLAKMLHLTETIASIEYLQIDSGSFIVPESLYINLDGEQVEVTSTEFKVLPHHLAVFAP
ncbi:diacylglycerol/lipid kinase family protein [Oceanobacillus saliphilus]|uniref:diacylglycerol/lipid kinase family protein n=1 Tax=Oceanobacillus saliphilus TaxID=2925834 RepID=UPI00201E1E2C|nr:YegS/Rv2252/BmrU family lipid kinase [Oceanobacillus saliphilus]